jgi:hypothetical protein
MFWKLLETNKVSLIILYKISLYKHYSEPSNALHLQVESSRQFRCLPKKICGERGRKAGDQLPVSPGHGPRMVSDGHQVVVPESSESAGSSIPGKFGGSHNEVVILSDSEWGGGAVWPVKRSL